MATHRKAIDNVARALDIWFRLNEPELIETGSDELARLYLVAQDVNSSVATMGRLAEYWRSQGKRDREGEALFTRSVRLLQAHRFEDALRELQPVIAFARENHLPALHAGCLDEKALLLRLLGRKAEAKATAEEASRVRERIEPDTQAVKDAQLPAGIPVGWVDVPEAPVAAEIRTVDGEERAVLTNRGTKSMVGVTIGCIVKQGEGWQTISELSGVAISDAQVGPGAYFDVTRMFGGPRNRWTNRPMGCDNAFPGVVGVRFADGSEWHLPSSSAP
jgi:tetratricopeptide (TPR) repeat protein